ncbi:MAG: endo-1,4-beta-xylanase [Spirochaetota bacterium]
MFRSMPSRRIVRFVAIATLAGLTVSCTSGPDADGGSRTAGRSDVPDLAFVGNVYPHGVGPDVPGSEIWTQLTPENAGKWGSVEPARDDMRWSQLDAAYAYAQERGIPFRYHTLIWGQQQPGWLADLSADEQLEEVLEWLDLLAERYPEVDFIDVVNEPVHETPVYADALGGAGEIGYDWVIRSFELAREAFPNAELHINDYNILTPRSDIHEYMRIIGLLADRGLVDGIGLQAHSLERADAADVARKLDTLAGYGLPLYITELEIAIRDDVRQAEQFSTLFRTLAEHPAVEGITLWGSRQNRMWRAEGYLVRSDGSFRPAMEWLVAYLAGEEYTIPTDQPTPRAGTRTSIRLDAEDYDNAEGVEVAGDYIAYVDGGDSVGFEAVEFRANYTALRIRYAKGGGEPAALRVMMIRPDGYEAARVELPETGGWNEFEEIEVEWPQTDGRYDVYLVFDGGEGVGNIDFVEFYEPGANAVLGFVGEADVPPEGGVLLQAEEADVASGIEVAGDVIAYIDDADYVMFGSVDFASVAAVAGSGTRLFIRYAKESATHAGVELRLDSLENDPIHSFQLAATGGWDTFRYAETTVPQISGTHDLYVTFRLADTTGVGNFDWFWFAE